MAISLSQGLIERHIGKVKAQKTGTGLSVLTGSTIIKDEASGFEASGFVKGYFAEIHGFTTAGNNVRAPVLDVSASRLTFDTGYLASAEAAGDSVAIYQLYPGSIRELAFETQLDYYSSPRPATADATEGAATLLASFTGVRIGAFAWDTTNKRGYFNLYGAALSVTPVASGTLVWARWRLGGITTTGASTTAPRIDLAAGVGSTYDLRVASIEIDTSNPESLTNVRLYLPQAQA